MILAKKVLELNKKTITWLVSSRKGYVAISQNDVLYFEYNKSAEVCQPISINFSDFGWEPQHEPQQQSLGTSVGECENIAIVRQENITADNDERLLDVDELAAVLNCKIHHVYNMKRLKKIPAYKLGGKLVRFKLSEVLEALKAK